jgi:hypothetical protein
MNHTLATNMLQRLYVKPAGSALREPPLIFGARSAGMQAIWPDVLAGWDYETGLAQVGIAVRNAHPAITGAAHGLPSVLTDMRADCDTGANVYINGTILRNTGELLCVSAVWRYPAT